MMFHCAWVRSIPTIDHRLTSLRIPDVLPIWFRCLGAAVVFVRRALASSRPAHLRVNEVRRTFFQATSARARLDPIRRGSKPAR